VFWSKNVILGFGVWTSFVLGKAYRARKGRFGVTFEVVGVIVARNLVSSWSHSNPDGCGVLVPKCHFWLNRWWNVRCVWKPFSCIPSRCFSKNYLAFHRHNCVCPPARAAVFILVVCKMTQRLNLSFRRPLVRQEENADPFFWPLSKGFYRCETEAEVGWV